MCRSRHVRRVLHDRHFGRHHHRRNDRLLLALGTPLTSALRPIAASPFSPIHHTAPKILTVVAGSQQKTWDLAANYSQTSERNTKSP